MSEKQPISELEQYLIEFRNIMQQTAKEQDILDGGDGAEIYRFTFKDVIDNVSDLDGAPTDKNVRKLFNK